ncbi:hypothetical protein NA56DRAFT_125997 [Hyaloscypha hepaticicola]|uniref:Uncharacterized protein n=1 Tax=Hyaloscypha hepaticicola TaxID=2082293 RepID=A0A2J6Q5D6_9HELO|nr:hypothetical protein NA56DRAFT_125997 [Hyaloscypha hepaticicola]
MKNGHPGSDSQHSLNATIFRALVPLLRRRTRDDCVLDRPWRQREIHLLGILPEMLNLAWAQIGAETLIGEKQFDDHLRLCISTWEKKRKNFFSLLLDLWASLHLHLQMHPCGARESFHVPEHFALLQVQYFVHVPSASGLIQAVRSSVSQ